MKRIPMVGVFLSFAGGVVLGRYLNFSFGLLSVVIVLGLLCALAGLWRRECKPLAMVGVLICAASFGAYRMELFWDAVSPDSLASYIQPGRTLVRLRGQVAGTGRWTESPASYPAPPEWNVLFEVQGVQTPDGWRAASGSVRLYVAEAKGEYPPGQVLEVIGWLEPFKPAQNPGQFDRAAQAKRDGLLAQLRTRSWDAAVPVGQASGWKQWWWRLRGMAESNIDDPRNPTGSELTDAMVLGQRSKGISELSETMRRAGIGHFLSISGLHLGVFLGFIYWICRVLQLSPRGAAGTVLAILGLYLLLAWPRPALWRSAIMAAALAMGVLLGRQASTLNSLAVAGLLILLFDPASLLGPGFQLSFLIVAALLLWTRPLKRMLFAGWYRRRGLMVFRGHNRWRRWWAFTAMDWLWTAMSMSILAWLAATPLVAWWFGFFSPWGAVLSLLLFPLVALVLVTGYLALGVGWIAPNLGYSITSVSAQLADGLAWIVKHLAHLPGLCIELRPVTWWWVVLAYGVLAAIMMAGRSVRQWTLAGLLLLGLTGATIWTQWPYSPPSHSAELNLLAIGAGQCGVLQGPSGDSWLIDVGSRDGGDVWTRTLNPFFRARRLNEPVGAVLSHGDSDHSGGFWFLPENLPLETIHTNVYLPVDPEAEIFRKALERKGMFLQATLPGQRLKLDEKTELEILWPPPGRENLSSNDTSLVIKIHCGGKTVLVPGDLDETGQAELLKQPSQLKADALVMPHHGGWENTLPAFVQAVDPEIILISANQLRTGASRGGETAKRFYDDLYNSSSRKVYYTGRDGWIRLRFGKRGLEVTTMREKLRR